MYINTQITRQLSIYSFPSSSLWFYYRETMDPLLAICAFLIPIFLLLFRSRISLMNSKLPPGSLGIPYIGQSLALLKNMRANTADEWFKKRAQKYGPISKLTLFGNPTVFIYGRAANKLIFNSDGHTLSNNQTKSLKMILGEKCLLELSGPDHKRVREAIMSFLRPESLKKYVGTIDEEVRTHIHMYWEGNQEVQALPLMKTLTFDIICTLLFGIEKGPKREKLVGLFQDMIAGVWSIPINLPFTRYNRSLKASRRVRSLVTDLIKEKKMQLENKTANPQQDLITNLINLSNQNNGQMITEKEILDNSVLVLTAGHDTSAILLTFLIRQLSNDPAVYAALLQEHEEIAKNKSKGEPLAWEDLTKMKYTWRVAQEILRMYPPVLSSFRTVMKDMEYEGYIIPKGWQVLWVASMTQMDEGIFKEPQKFDPTRFETPSSIPPYTYVPFGGGPRICPGYEFAKIETLVTIHYLITQFTWKMTADNFFSRDPMPIPTEGLPIKLTPKNQIL